MNFKPKSTIRAINQPSILDYGLSLSLYLWKLDKGSKFVNLKFIKH